MALLMHMTLHASQNKSRSNLFIQHIVRKHLLVAKQCPRHVGCIMNGRDKDPNVVQLTFW